VVAPRVRSFAGRILPPPPGRFNGYNPAMKVRIGGPIQIRFEMNGLMLLGCALGVAGVGVWALAHFAILLEDPRWDDVALGVILVGISLYFLGRIVDLVAHFKRRG
jgi:hypothetical protein